MGMIALNFLKGFTQGYRFIDDKHDADEVKQGQNDYFGALHQGLQVMDTVNLFSTVAERTPLRYRVPFQIFCNVLYCGAIPAQIFCVIYKEGHYEKFAAFWNRYVIQLRLPPRFQFHRKLSQLHLPKIPAKLDLSRRTVVILCFFVDHMGTVTSVAMVVGNLFLIVQGRKALAVGALLALTYDLAHRRLRIVPKHVNLSYEEIMPIVSKVVGVFQGTWVGRLWSFLSGFTFKKSIFLSVQHQWDDFVRSHMNQEAGPIRPTLREIDAPRTRHLQLSYEEINSILSANDNEFEIDFAATSKSVGELELAEDQDFNKLLKLFNTIDWTTKYRLILPKLKDDERFLKNFLKPELTKIDSSFANREIQDLLPSFESHVDQVAKAKGVTKENYVAHWIQDQMKYLIGILKYENPIEGTEEDRKIAISRCAKITTYLHLKAVTQIIKENYLLKLAVEGGAYCGIQIKLASGEILEEIDQTTQTPQDNIEAYENKILRALEKRRKSAIENDWGSIQSYFQTQQQTLMTSEQGFLLAYFMRDLHSFENTKFLLGMGFLPMTEKERAQFDFLDFLIWRFIARFTLPIMVQKYQTELDTVTQSEKGDLQFGLYLYSMIHSMNFSKDQKETLFIQYTECPQSQILKVKHQFKRLLFYKMGVLKRKATTF